VFNIFDGSVEERRKGLGAMQELRRGGEEKI
jgi:hypothetical protein